MILINTKRLLTWKYLGRRKWHKTATWTAKSIGMIYDPETGDLFSQIYVRVFFQKEGRIIREHGYLTNIKYNEQIEENLVDGIHKFIEEQIYAYGE